MPPPDLSAATAGKRRPVNPAELAALTPGVFSQLGRDLPAGVVVFLVALPLCLGIAIASGAPAFSGLVAGIVPALENESPAIIERGVAIKDPCRT